MGTLQGKDIYLAIDETIQKMTPPNKNSVNMWIPIEEMFEVATKYNNLMTKEYHEVEVDPNLTSDEKDYQILLEIKNKLLHLNHHSLSIGVMTNMLHDQLNYLETKLKK
jgi:hypothetical protein